MHSLRELQRGFAAAIDHTDDRVVSLIGATHGHGARRLNVYRNNIRTTLTETLGAIYPVVRRLVGDDFFKRCAQAYITGHPSRSGDLNDYGTAFANFLAAFEPARPLPYLADVARLEWAYHAAFHAADATALALERLAAVAPERHEALRFALHPSAHLTASPYPVLKIWKANQDGADIDAIIALDDGGDTVLVVRPQHDVEFVRLDRAAFEFLAALQRGEPFARACDAALTINVEFELNDFLAFCVSHGVIVDFILPENPS